MAGQFGEMVPGESCFSLNFVPPNGATVNGDAPSGTSGTFTPSPSTTMTPTPSSTFVDPKNRPLLPNGKKTKGRVKIKMEFIDNKLRRYTTFSKRKTGIMKKAYELSTLTGTQVMLLVASETGHVYTFATKKLQPMITSEAGKALIQTCLNTPESGAEGSSPSHESVGALSTNFHTSEITPSSNGASSANSNGVSRKKPRPSQQGLTFVNDNKPSKNNSKNTSSYYNNSSSIMNDLPTMVPPTSFFSSSGSSAGLRSSDDDDDDDDDEDDEMTPSPTSPLVEQPNSSQSMADLIQSVMANGSGAATKQSKQQNSTNVPSAVGGSPLFPFASFIPASSAGQTQQPAFGFLPAGLAPNGAFMYQMPQGLVYAAPPMNMADGTASAHQNFMLASSGESNGQSGQQQQFITIPVPMSLTQQMIASQLLGNMSSEGMVKKIQQTENDDSD